MLYQLSHNHCPIRVYTLQNRHRIITIEKIYQYLSSIWRLVLSGVAWISHDGRLCRRTKIICKIDKLYTTSNIHQHDNSQGHFHSSLTSQACKIGEKTNTKMSLKGLSGFIMQQGIQTRKRPTHQVRTSAVPATQQPPYVT